MAPQDAVRIALRQLMQYKRRSFLTMLGVIIGIAAVIVVVSVGAGAQGLIINAITSVGSNLVGILPGGSEENGPPAAAMGIVITTLTSEDIQSLRAEGVAPHIVAASGYVKGIGTARFGDHASDITFTGVDADFPRVEDVTLREGRFFESDEEKRMDHTAVLGSLVKQDLFGDADAIGAEIKIKQDTFKVVGVLAPLGANSFQNYDSQVFVPLTTAQKILLGIRHISLARLKIDSADHVDESVQLVKEVLRSRHGIRRAEDDDFSVRSQNDALRALTHVTDALKLFLAAVAGLALVVGGVGIMNIMLIAVNERVKEIGVRKAVGATARHIIWQFVIETVVLTMIAGCAGIIAGSATAVLIAVSARALGYDWALVISWQSIASAVAMSMIVGILAGLYPAFKASRLQPVEALRYE